MKGIFRYDVTASEIKVLVLDIICCPLSKFFFIFYFLEKAKLLSLIDTLFLM